MSYTPDFIINKKEFFAAFEKLSVEKKEELYNEGGFYERFQDCLDIDESGFNTFKLYGKEFIVHQCIVSCQTTFLSEWLDKHKVNYARTY